MAEEAHKGQKRDEGTPYITHIVEVVKILKDEFMFDSYDYLTVAALHDVVEDTEYTYEDIKERFGTIIADYVNVLTKKDGQTMDQYIEGIHNFTYSNQVSMIKLADRLHNLRSLLNIQNNRKKLEKYILETEKYYLPMAERLHEKIVYDKLTVAVEEVKMVIQHG